MTNRMALLLSLSLLGCGSAPTGELRIPRAILNEGGNQYEWPRDGCHLAPMPITPDTFLRVENPLQMWIFYGPYDHEKFFTPCYQAVRGSFGPGAQEIRIDFAGSVVRWEEGGRKTTTQRGCHATVRLKPEEVPALPDPLLVDLTCTPSGVQFPAGPPP